MRARRTAPITTLPADYREVRRFSVSKGSVLITLNILSFFPLIISGLLVFGLLMIYHAELDAPLVIHALPDDIPRGIGITLIILVLPLHEWIHGLWIARYGHKARYGAKWFVLFATSDNALFRRDEFIQIALAPLVLISAGGIASMVFLPVGLAEWVALAVTINAAGAIGDIWMTAIVMRYETHALIRDEETSMRIFVPHNAVPISHRPE